MTIAKIHYSSRFYPATFFFEPDGTAACWLTPSSSPLGNTQTAFALRSLAASVERKRRKELLDSYAPPQAPQSSVFESLLSWVFGGR
ncbi:hypothetical protein, partial [uncultured Rikenella sp.]